MIPDLRPIQNEPLDRDLALVTHRARVLNDLTERSRSFTTKTQVREFEAALSEAISASASVDVSAVASELAASMRPATLQEIKRQLQVLIGSFPNSSKQDLSIFGVALLEDVAAEQPAIAVLTNTCRKLRRTNTFVPTISEVLGALADENLRHEALLSDVQEFAMGITKAESAVVTARERVEQVFERMVRFCVSRIQCQQSANFFDPEVVTEARRRIGPDIDEATREISKKRLAPLLKAPAMPTKDSGWNP